MALAISFVEIPGAGPPGRGDYEGTAAARSSTRRTSAPRLHAPQRPRGPGGATAAPKGVALPRAAPRGRRLQPRRPRAARVRLGAGWRLIGLEVDEGQHASREQADDCMLEVFRSRGL